jgi:hypothetical protein
MGSTIFRSECMTTRRVVSARADGARALRSEKTAATARSFRIPMKFLLGAGPAHPAGAAVATT